MSIPTNSPWNVSERLHLLSSILLSAQIDVQEVLLQVILDKNVQPAWEYIPLPNGRSIQGCRDSFTEMMKYFRPLRPFLPVGNVPYGMSNLAPPTHFKRSFSEQEAPPSTQRILQPRPPRSTDSPVPINTNGESSFTIMRSHVSDLSVERKRKRGRPTKEEREERDRAYAAEGKVYEPKKRPPKKIRASTGELVVGDDAEVSGSPDPQTPVPQLREPHEETSSGKRRSRKQRDEHTDISMVETEPVSPIRVDRSPSDRLLARHGDRDHTQSHIMWNPPMAKDVKEEEEISASEQHTTE